ncbi:olfactory receptor 2D3-like [Hemicordylus capensis]|uniref:olfactory receptor 2D3-like n=1 Tax=Hemicordylus capensis TaxID=884348 RepID=UPI0023049B11|nr:olfactory receptor 2D3-like [Hemicordylus capensis]
MGTENITAVREFIFMAISKDHKKQILLFMVIVIIYFLTMMGNLLIILLVQMDSRLHTPMYFFLMNLSGLEVCFVTCTMPQMLVNLLNGNGAISFTRCIAQMYVGTTAGGTECLLLAAMAYDRYLAICCPLQYAVAMGRLRQLQLASASLLGGFLIATINVSCTLRHPFCGPNHINHFCCEVPIVLKFACADTRLTEIIVSVTSILILVGPLSVILTSYGLILSTVLQMQSATSQRKAFSTCTSHLVVVTMFFGSAIAMYGRPNSGSVPNAGRHFAIVYIVITPLLNPVIYTLRNKDVHQALAKVLKRQTLTPNG